LGEIVAASGIDGGESFALYLARTYIAQKGFAVGTVPEAQRLLAASDIVLTHSDGLVFQIVCIVDCEANPGKHFALSRELLHEIGTACLKYSGKTNRIRMPVVIQVMEVGPAGNAGLDRNRLRGLKRRSIFSKVHIQAWIVDTESKAVWSNVPFNGLLSGRRFIESLLRRPRASVVAAMRKPAPLVQDARPLVATSALLAMLAAVFVAEQVFALEPVGALFRPGVRTLIALGGLNSESVLQSGDWYRLLSATALHGDLMHLAFNGIALFFAGVVLERLVGRAWFLAIYLIGGLGGSLLSLAINPRTLVSVGASGAIMALLAAACIASFRLPAGTERMVAQVNMLRILVPSLLPLATAGGHQVDYAAHFGGAIGGTVTGLLLFGIWPATSPLPRFRAGAAALALAGFVACAATLVPIARHYRLYTLIGLLIPPEQLPKTDAAAAAQSADLVARYPRDPRAHWFRAIALLQANDDAGGERELRAGLAEQEILQHNFTPEMEWRLRGMLALVLQDDRRTEEAKALARPVCATKATIRAALAKALLCD